MWNDFSKMYEELWLLMDLGFLTLEILLGGQTEFILH